MDFLTCALILPIAYILLQIIETLLKFNRFGKTNSYSFRPQHVTLDSAEDCKVVLEDISFSWCAAKLQMLHLSKDKTHTTDSHHTTESDFLKNLCLETPIGWANSVDERWTQLDDKVSDKLHMCDTFIRNTNLPTRTDFFLLSFCMRLARRKRKVVFLYQVQHVRFYFCSKSKTSIW